MALTVNPVAGTPPGVIVWNYDNLDSADSAPTAIEAGRFQPVFGSIQVAGTMGGATVKLQGSNDNTSWADLNDVSGTAIALTTAQTAAEFSTTMRYIRPLATGGSGDDIDVFICLRG